MMTHAVSSTSSGNGVRSADGTKSARRSKCSTTAGNCLNAARPVPSMPVWTLFDRCTQKLPKGSLRQDGNINLWCSTWHVAGTHREDIASTAAWIVSGWRPCWPCWAATATRNEEARLHAV